MTPEKWSDAKIQCATDAIGDALQDGCGILAGIFEDIENHERYLAVFQWMTERWVRHHATDYTMEWSFFVDGFFEEEYDYYTDADQHFTLSKPLTIDGRK